jgi:Divergent InlB B-repeat domain
VTNPRAAHGPRRGRRAVALWSVALLLILSAIVAGGLVGAPNAATANAGTSLAAPAAASSVPAGSAAPAHGAPSTAPATGRGTFFLDTPIPTPLANQTSCPYALNQFALGCMNNTGAPSIVSTSAGVIATAYTAFTNASVCPADGNLTYTEIGVVVSTNGGGTFGAPTYLDNPDCSQAFNYTSAISPSLTALGNGTLVLAYIEYNVSSVSNFCSGYIWYPALSPCFVPYDRLVVTESFNDGASWTFPAVINSTSNTGLNQTSWMAAQPSIAAVGTTVYLAWTNFTEPYFDSNAPPSIGLQMVVSTDGGLTWGSPTVLPTVTGAFFGATSYTDYAPAVLIGTNGELYVAYATDFQENTTPICIPAGCSTIYPDETMNVVVARSVNNGSTFSLATVGRNVPVVWNGFSWIAQGPGTLVSPAPAIAQDPTTGELFVTWTGGQVGEVCFTGSSCFAEEGFESAWVAHAPRNASGWSTPVDLGTGVLQTAGGATDDESLFTPSIGVGANGTVYVNVGYENDSACLSGFACDLQTDLVFESNDHGVTFPDHFYPYSNSSYYDYPLWDGVRSSIAVYDGVPYIAWTQEVCPGNGLTISCSSSYGFGYGYSQVIISSPFEGTGVNVTFTESGLAAGVNWSADLSGNLRSGPAGTSLVVSGVPSGPFQSWSVPWVNLTYGYAFASNATPASPGAITGNTTIGVAFNEDVLLTIFTVPPAQAGEPFWCGVNGGFFGDECSNMEVNPTPGSTWVPRNSSIAYNITDTGLPASCFRCYNYSFVSWTGTGAGSWNTTLPNGTAILYGPVNETANFAILNVCQFGSCTNVSYGYLFQEIGLPANTTWAVTLGNQTLESSTPDVGFSTGSGPYAFTVWTVPENATYSWLGTPSYPSPITSLQGATETVRFSLVADASLPTELTVSATGLPSGVSTWGFTADTTTYSVPPANATLDLAAGSHLLNATSVYGSSQVGAYVTGFVITPEAMNATPYTVLPGASAELAGPALITAQYSPEYWVGVSASVGGSVAPSSVGWTPSGQAVNLSAAAETGYAFLGWTGTGGGSITATTLSITITPTGPVTEVASFVAVTPTYTVAVSATGLQPGVPLTLTIGTETLTLPAPFNVSGLVAGSYPLALPTVYPNATFGVRYAATSVTSSLGLTSGVLLVDQNGTIGIGYAVSYAVTVTPAVNGTTVPGPGTYWELGGTAVTLTAAPAVGHEVVGWTGVGPGAGTSPNATVTFTPTGPDTETATFAVRPAVVPATFSLTVEETGLPTEVAWSVATGPYGVSGTGTLVLTGLNGSYTLVVPTVPGATGVRYAPSSNGSLPVSVTAAGQVATVVFTTQYALTLTSSAGGSATPGTEWVDAGASVSIAATPANASYVFVNWSGTGAGSYTGTSASATVTVNDPVTELATFAPARAGSGTTSSSSGLGDLLLPIGLLLVLLIVGLVVGLLLARRPPSASPSPPSEDAAYGDADEGAADVSPSDAPAPPSGADSDGPETIFGGGPG